MSNRIEPKLNTILDPLPKTNIIKPLNMRSKNFDSFPPLKTPKLQPLNVEVVKYIGLRNIPNEKSEKVKQKIIKSKKIKEETSYLSLNLILSIFFIFMLILIIRKNKK